MFSGCNNDGGACEDYTAAMSQVVAEPIYLTKFKTSQ